MGLTWHSVLIGENNNEHFAEHFSDWSVVNASWLVSWEAVTARHWSASILLISRERIVWEAVNIIDIKPWNMFSFQFSFRSHVFIAPPSAHLLSCSLFMFFSFRVKKKNPKTMRAAERNDSTQTDEWWQSVLLVWLKHLNRMSCSTKPEPEPEPGQSEPEAHVVFYLPLCWINKVV